LKEVKEVIKEEKKETKEETKAKQEKQKQEKPKQERGKKTAAVEAPPAVDEVWDVYRNCDLRVGRIVECSVHPQSEKLYVEKIDVGEPGKLRTIGSGLQQFIPLSEMTKGLCMVFVNLKPRKLADIMSEGMVMCASNADHTQIELMRPPEGSVVGERIQLEGNPILGTLLSSNYEAVLNPKKKYAERFLPMLKTSDGKEGLYNGVRLVTSKGVVVCHSLANSSIS
jgi:methionine--tRNA ligase beta chain